jgi:hypothetical protein
MPASLSVYDMNREFTFKQLIEEVQDAVEMKVPEFAEQVEYHLRDDEKISVHMPGITGILEIELDDLTAVHLYCSMHNTLEKLRIALGVIEYLTEKYGGEYDKDEVRLLNALLG